jgi:uracil-DNA glycosylase
MLSEIIGESWTKVIGEEFDKEYMQKLSAWISYQRESKTIYPDSEDVFRALKLCPHGQVKVVIIGQEPYYQGNADGLAFSYKNGFRMGQGMQSLDVILNEIENDCYQGFNINREYQLDYLAKQGVLLLNSVLTVFRGRVGSHKDIGWEKLTSKIIQTQIEEKSPKVFMLWGNDAKVTWSNAIGDTEKLHGFSLYGEHLVLDAYHPAYDLHKRDSSGNITVQYPDGFTGCKHFSKANDFLIKNQLTAINWFDVNEPHFNEPINEKGYPVSWETILRPEQK